MKAYPTKKLRVYGEEIEIPTDEAVKNFHTYLEPDELEKYNLMSDADKLFIALSVNIFGAFQMVVERLDCE